MGNAQGSGGKGGQVQSPLARLYSSKASRKANQKSFAKVFLSYSNSNRSFLNEGECKAYIEELLEISGVDAQLVAEAADNAEAGSNPRELRDELIDQIYSTLDPSDTGKVNVSAAMRFAPNADLVAVVQLAASKMKKKVEGRSKLIRSNKMNSVQFDDFEGKPCVNECGLYACDENGYCQTCLDFIRKSLEKSQSLAMQYEPDVIEESSSSSFVEDDDDDDDDDQNSSGDEDDDLEYFSDADAADFFDSVSEETVKDRWKRVSSKELMKLMEKKTKEAAELLYLSYDDSSILMRLFGYNLEHLKESYFTDQDTFNVLAGIAGQSAKEKIKHDPDEELECEICFDDVAAKDTLSLSCNHVFCNTCWGEYLHDCASTRGKDEILGAKCMARGCDLTLPFSFWKKAAKRKDRERFLYFFTKSYVESTPNIGFCPQPDCGEAVLYTGYSIRAADVVECACGANYCFGCLQPAHNPISCEQLQTWKAKSTNEEDSLKLIRATSKPCPKCHTAITRNQGCNHMTCRKAAGGCGAEWCWMCRGMWRTHGSATGGYYECNKYKMSSAYKEDQHAEDGIAQLKIFQFFEERFLGQESLKRDTVKLREPTIEKTITYRDVTTLSGEFLVDGLETLIKCRDTLKWTFAFAWCLETAASAPEPPAAPAASFMARFQKRAQASPKKPLMIAKQKKELFNFQQDSLAQLTEQLADLVFKALEEYINSPALGEELRNTTAVVKKTLRQMCLWFEEMAEGGD